MGNSLVVALPSQLAELAHDRKNNVEKVTVLTPDTGSWTVQVYPYDVGYFNQPFSLVVSGGLESNFDGWVKDASTGAGISSATVSIVGRIDSYSTPADFGGYYSEQVRPDKYTLTASRCDYEPGTVIRTIEPGVSLTETLELDKRVTGTVHGYVKDTNSIPLSNALVYEYCASTSDLTDSNGYYSLTIPGNININVRASKSGYYSQTKTANVPYGGSQWLHFSLLSQGGCFPRCPFSPSRDVPEYGAIQDQSLKLGDGGIQPTATWNADLETSVEAIWKTASSTGHATILQAGVTYRWMLPWLSRA